MERLDGAERLILKKILDLPKNSAGYVEDTQIAKASKIPLQDVRDWLETLDGKGFVERAKGIEGFSAYSTAKGKQALGLTSVDEVAGGKPSSQTLFKIRPRGLQPFRAEDKDFFLKLLPNPNPADGLPESVSFWKTRIEESRPDQRFRIGLIYGPSGCGKSSIVKAGLIPSLAAHVHCVYVEATPDNTEAGLLEELRFKCPELKKIRTLGKFMSTLRNGQAIPAGHKVVIVLDQFEQWLHAKSGIENTELVQTLMQCDGEHVQAIVLVRDDFWTAITRFSTQTRVKFLPDLNSYFVDLFHQRHGEKVLTMFGQACGEVNDPVTPEEKAFIELAVKSLALDSMILPVRLGLFFLVFQGLAWTKGSLESIGGIKNIEVEVLNKVFNLRYSDPRYRDHREAAQSVLVALLPESASEIKRQRSWQELLVASGYLDKHERFEQLLRILDKELFLITPVEHEQGLDADRGHSSDAGDRFYQLTHDFLVPSLREWRNKNQEASQLVEAIWMAETKNVPQLLEKLAGLRVWANPLLLRVIEKSGEGSKERLHASLALLPVDGGQVEYLFRGLLNAGPAEIEVIRDALRPFRAGLIERLWRELEDSAGPNHTLQAASALALYDPSSHRWEDLGSRVAKAMVTVNAVHLGFWLHALRPVRDRLTTALAALYQDRNRSETERNLASNLLEDYATDKSQLLTDLLMNSGEDHFALWFGKLATHDEIAVPLLKEELEKSVSDATEAEKDDGIEAQKDGLAERQARAAIALLRFGHPGEIWPRLQHSSDPRLRSFIVNWLAPMGANPSDIIRALDRLPATAKPNPAPGQQFMEAVLFHPEISMRRALILALGTYGTDALSPGEREPLTTTLLDLYRNDADSGVHGAAAWTLRRWGQGDRLKTIGAELMKLKEKGERRWYVNSQGQTFVVIEGPVEYWMGSPTSEPDRFDKNETMHRRVTPRRFAIAATEVPVRQFQAFLRETPALQFRYLEKYSPDPDGPQTQVSWYQAAGYCDWLSRKEGLHACYEPNSEGEYAAGMKIKPDALSLGGYRLPTEGEWEYACRAGAGTSRYYGASVDLLGRYARYSATSQDHAWSCGSLLPNDLGLFDMLGNVFEWVLEVFSLYQPDDRGRVTESEAVKDAMVNDSNPRLLRGGSFVFQPAIARSAFRDGVTPAERISSLGFRPARTLP
jgi:formylglycine-generating enzyme required for sulfatase activity